ncbi:hypothetical protein LZ30DRAFT_380363 [Colletotrichum cereale]|nr:hypothetical protein LZ30DRAFT_380363 [Colletotrichum cereale]
MATSNGYGDDDDNDDGNQGSESERWTVPRERERERERLPGQDEAYQPTFLLVQTTGELQAGTGGQATERHYRASGRMDKKRSRGWERDGAKTRSRRRAGLSVSRGLGSPVATLTLTNEREREREPLRREPQRHRPPVGDDDDAEGVEVGGRRDRAQFRRKTQGRLDLTRLD